MWFGFGNLVNIFISVRGDLIARARVCAHARTLEKMPTRELGTILAALKGATSRDFSGRSFQSRLRIQKAVYFLRAFGYGPAKEYSFGDYFHGPYSPKLANQYYDLRSLDPAGVAVGLMPTVPTAAIEFLREATKAGNDMLEAAATMHAFLTRNRDASGDDAIAYLGKVKGWLVGRGREALSLLEKHGLVLGAT